MKMRVADFITSKLYDAGAEKVFMVTGGMIMHLTDAVFSHKKLKFVCCHHEQSAVMAAEAYARLRTGKIGAAYVTAGPGALNTLTGVVGAFVDSAPCVIVAGQSKAALAKITKTRQFALQGYNTLPIFEKVTKYAVMLDDIKRVRYEVEKAIHIALEGRVGPVWIECPVDVQGMWFDPDDYEGYLSDEKETSVTFSDNDDKIEEIVKALQNAKRPCILAGAGVRLSGAVELLHETVERTGIPILTSRLGMDLIGNDHPLFVGRPGTYGERAANFAVQNCDFLLVLGCRLGIGLVSYEYQKFAEKAIKVIVDIDKEELEKPSVIPDIKVHSDAGQFLKRFLNKIGKWHFSNPEWIERIQLWREKYPVDLDEYKNETQGINSYHFMRRFSEMVSSDSIFLVDTGSCFHVHAQAFKVKEGQRHVITGGLSTMGYMPASIGIASADLSRPVYCITGDGSIQMNLQEIQTIVGYKLPIKIIMISNNGYLLIRHTQNNFCSGHFIGESPETGVTIPDMSKIANAFGIKYFRLDNIKNFDQIITEVINHKECLICEVITPSNQMLIPRVASKQLPDGKMVSMPFDDMYPFLPREEYEQAKKFSS
jgi:acetolactate synthase-1/2/3 large subunit